MAVRAGNAHPRLRVVVRAVVTTAAVIAVTGLLGRSAVASASRPDLRLDDVVGAAVLAVAALAAGLLSVGLVALTVSAVAQALGGSLRAADTAARRLTPAVMRRVVTAGIGVGLGLGTTVSAHAADPDLLWVVTDEPGVSQTVASTPAQATPTTVAPEPAQVDLLDPEPPVDDVGAPSGSPTTRSGASGGAGRPVAAAHVPAAPADADSRTADVVVRPGDTLWSIASTHLGPDASDGEIAREWPRWHAANRDVIGGDPHHIEPGQALVVPSGDDR